MLYLHLFFLLLHFSYKANPKPEINIGPGSHDGSSLHKVNRFIDRIVLRTWYLDTTLKALLNGETHDAHWKTTVKEVKGELDH